MKLRRSMLLLPGALILAASAGYGLRVYAEGAPTAKPLFYAGTLESGGMLAKGPHTIALTLYDAEVAGKALCTSETPNAPVDGGRFRVEVSADCVAAMKAQPDVWAGLKFTGPDGVPHELPVRSKLGAVPYAMEAQHAVSADNGSPPGTIVAFGGSDADIPPGWLHCNGRAVKRADYPQLYAAIKTAWGNGTTGQDAPRDFNLPDLRGRFLRGTDSGALRDPERGERQPQMAGGNPGNLVGSVQSDSLRAHSHPITDRTHTHSLGHQTWGFGPPNGSTTYVFGVNGSIDNNVPTNASYTGITGTEASVGSETRPINASVIYIIKY